MIRLAFRLDDPSPSSNQAIERRIMDAMARHGCRATFAAIPFSATPDAPPALTRERASAMREAVAQGIIDIALHGHSHTNFNPDGHPTEFAGVPALRQRERIAAGKDLLESVFERPIRGFVPPWNSFDEATLEALEQTGFDYLSSNTGRAPSRFTELRMLPLSCHLPRLKRAVEEARRFVRLAPVVTVVMHHYDFPGGSERPVFQTYGEFDALLAWIAAQEDVQVKTLGELAGELSATESQRVFRHLRLRDRLPWRFRDRLPDLCCATRPLFLP